MADNTAFRAWLVATKGLSKNVADRRCQPYKSRIEAYSDFA